MIIPRMGHYDRRGEEYKDAVREFFLGLESIEAEQNTSPDDAP